jgi:predicted Zn-dependent peptidase
VLSRGKASRLYLRLVKEQKLFTDIGAYMLGDLDKSLFIVEGKLVKGVTMQEAEKAILLVIEEVKKDISKAELKKVQHKLEAGLVFGEMSITNKALNLAYFEMLGEANDANLQIERYNAVTTSEIIAVAKAILRPENCSILRYNAIQ